MFEVIPAVDILQGKCVRLKQGRYDKKTIYYEDPLEAALHWQDKGAQRLHVVDLDGAKTGTPENIEILKKIVLDLDIPVQAGGGIRNTDLIDELLGLGLDRIILGTSAIFNPNLLENVCKRHGDKIAVAVDAKNDQVVAHGWTQVSSKNIITLAQEAIQFGAKRFIYTDISRDGMLKGPNLTSIQRFISQIRVPVIASGGVTSKDDVLKIKELGAEGVIIGKALYTGAIQLEEIS